MPVPKAVRTAVILTPTLVLVVVAGWFLARPGSAGTGSAASAPEVGSGKLVVLVVFDQMRGDYPDRWASAFGPDGFERMKAEGVWYANCHLPYACSSTGPGHASIATGAPPAVHGIVENNWYDPRLGKMQYCVYSDDPLRRVPPVDDKPRKPAVGLSPVRLLVPTVCDVVAGGKTPVGKAFSLSLKDRSAVLMGGQAPSGAYCFDSDYGEFHTSAYYRDAAHAWVVPFNDSQAANRWQGQAWDRLLPVARYTTLAGPDDVAGEGKTNDLAARVFPHPLPGIKDHYGKPYYQVLEGTPFGSELLWQFAKTAITEERLGQSGTRDLLCLSFSSNDIIGHAFGPDSQEVLDVTARSDRLIGEMIAFLHERVGDGNYSLVVTADHGVCPLPEVAVKTHPEARRANSVDFVAGLDVALAGAFGKLDGTASWFVDAKLRDTWPWVYLNEQAIRNAGFPLADVERYAAEWIGNRDGVHLAVARSRLKGPPLPASDPARSIQLGFHPTRCGNVCVVTQPYLMVDNGFTNGTSHGTLHDYDRHVPVLAFGAGVPRLGRRDEAVSSLVVAPLVSRLLGVEPPAAAKEPLPAELAQGPVTGRADK